MTLRFDLMTEHERSFEPYRYQFLTTSPLKATSILLLMAWLLSVPAKAAIVEPSENTIASEALSRQNAAEQTEKADKQELKSGRIAEREIVSGQAHNYRISLPHRNLTNAPPIQANLIYGSSFVELIVTPAFSSRLARLFMANY